VKLGSSVKIRRCPRNGKRQWSGSAPAFY